MPAADATTPTIRATLAQRLVAPIALLVLAAIGFIGSAGSEQASESPLRSLALGLTIGAVLLFAGSTRIRLELAYDELVVGSIFSSGRVPWSAIRDIEVGTILGSRGVAITTDQRVTRLRVPRAGWGPWQNPAFDEEVAQLVAAWERGTKGKGSGRGKGGKRR